MSKRKKNPTLAGDGNRPCKPSRKWVTVCLWASGAHKPQGLRDRSWCRRVVWGLPWVNAIKIDSEALAFLIRLWTSIQDTLLDHLTCNNAVVYHPGAFRWNAFRGATENRPWSGAKEAKLDMLSEWEGWNTLSLARQSLRLANHGCLWAPVWGRG